MGNYEFVEDLQSDVMFEARGESLDDLLETASRALFSIVCDIDRIDPVQSFEMEVEGDDEKDLIHEYLSRLLTESDIRGLFFSHFEVRSEKKLNRLTVRAKVSGEPITPEKGGTVAKGITYYGLSIEQSSSGYTARIAVDV
jgi:SHS2 domain-containing protein